MRIDSISNNSFQGKLILSPYLSEKEMKFAKEILNYKLDGISNKQLLSKKKFDMSIRSYNYYKTEADAITLNSYINYIIQEGFCNGDKNRNYNPIEIKMSNTAEEGAKILRDHFADTEKLIAERYPTHYYGIWEGFKQKMRVLFGKV